MNLAKIIRPAETRVRAPRIGLEQILVVESKTLGTNISYRLATENISKSGMLLAWENDSKVPFIVNTIIEMTIDPKNDLLKAPVNCLGKIVRREDKTTGATKFGVRIVQIENADLEVWETCVSVLERKAKHLISDGDGINSDEPVAA